MFGHELAQRGHCEIVEPSEFVGLAGKAISVFPLSRSSDSIYSFSIPRLILIKGMALSPIPGQYHLDGTCAKRVRLCLVANSIWAKMGLVSINIPVSDSKQSTGLWLFICGASSVSSSSGSVGVQHSGTKIDYDSFKLGSWDIAAILRRGLSCYSDYSHVSILQALAVWHQPTIVHSVFFTRSIRHDVPLVSILCDHDGTSRMSRCQVSDT